VWVNTSALTPAGINVFLTRFLPGGNHLVIANDLTDQNPYTNRAQVIQELDLAGNVVAETNVRVLDEELKRRGQTDPLIQFHHEIIRLASGRTLVFGFNERMFPAGVQGSTQPVDILGTYILELDQDFQLTWFWNAFDKLDVNRRAILNERCAQSNYFCPPLKLATVANDWLHPNSIFYVPADKSLLISLRNQDWVIKIDYNDGAGSGNVIWRLGAGGDFTTDSADPYPWFTHQHDAEIESNGVLTIYDNATTRRQQIPAGNSRGQGWRLDEVNRRATLVLNADLGAYAHALGSAERLPNGNYSFCSGWIMGEGGAYHAESVEVLPTGEVNFVQRLEGTIYRGFRLADLYNP
jgi:hypothetical protein